MSDRERLVKALESVIEYLDKRTSDVSGTVYISSQQPLGDISQPLWHIRRGNFVQLRVLALAFDARGPLSHIARVNGWESEFEHARDDFFTAFDALNRIRYFQSETPVELGDRVRLRHLFSKKSGRVVYLPGVSQPNSEIDFGGLFRLGVSIEDGTFTAYHVDPDSLAVVKSVEFEGRDSEGIPEMPSDEELRE